MSKFGFRHYPAGPIAWLTIGITGLIVALISWIANVFNDVGGTAIAEIYVSIASPWLFVSISA